MFFGKFGHINLRDITFIFIGMVLVALTHVNIQRECLISAQPPRKEVDRDSFSNPPKASNLQEFLQNFHKIKCPLIDSDLPLGMIGLDESCFLYKCGLVLDGPFLEQGSWGGRSTVALAMGIRDSGLRKTLISFDIYPLSPKLHEIYPDIPNYFQELKNGDFIEHIWNETNLQISKQTYEAFFKQVTGTEGGQFNYIYNSIAKHNLFEFVFLGVGHAIPHLPYSLVWSDCAHDQNEVLYNAKFWTGLRQQETLFAFHDTDESSEHTVTLREILKPTMEAQVSSSIHAFVSPAL